MHSLPFVDPPAVPVSLLAVSSFPPEVAMGCRALVLGTMPGIRSLTMQQFYAHPRNLFWPLMGEFFGAGPELPYAMRMERLNDAGIGLWDVLEHCERAGSLDGSIRPRSEIPNDIAGLLERHPSIGAIVLNGAKAAAVFDRRIEPRLEPRRLAQLTVFRMPSTSPANAGTPYGMKRDRWSALHAWIRNGPPHE